MFHIVSKYLNLKGYLGMTVFPFGIVRDKTAVENLVLMNHKRIHLRQYLELLILPFDMRYFQYQLECDFYMILSIYLCLPIFIFIFTS